MFEWIKTDMMRVNRNITIFSAPSNLGLKQFGEHEPGVRNFAHAILQTNFSKTIKKLKSVVQVPAPPYSIEPDSHYKLRNVAGIVQYSQQLADKLNESYQDQDFQFVVGGDCSILIGCSLALKRRGNFGLFFLDGHTDFMLPQHSGTGGVAGLDLALVSGHGPEILTNIENRKPYFNEQNVFCVGNRELDLEYVALIQASTIRYYDLFSSREITWKRIATDFLENVSGRNLDGFWIHLDVDVLDDRIMPCVDSRQKDGMSYDELKEVLGILISSQKCSGMDITIYDPTLDPDGIYLYNFANTLKEVMTMV